MLMRNHRGVKDVGGRVVSGHIVRMLVIFLAWRLVAILWGYLIRVDKSRLPRRDGRMPDLARIVANHVSDGAEKGIIDSILLCNILLLLCMGKT